MPVRSNGLSPLSDAPLVYFYKSMYYLYSQLILIGDIPAAKPAPHTLRSHPF